MAKLGRWIGYTLIGLLLLLLVAAGLVWALSAMKMNARPDARAERLIPTEQASLDLGRHLLISRGCVECHGPDLRGTRFLDIPNVVTLYAPNLTLLAKNATDQQLAQAIRQGIASDGRPLLVMPSESYSALTDAETAALIKAIRALPEGGSATPAPALGPLGRVGLVTGKLNTAPALVAEYAKAPPADFGPRFAAGRHIAMTVCSGCHGSTLSGKEPQPGITAPDLTIAGAYDLPAFTRLMREGLPPSGRELKMMTGVSRKAFHGFTDEEIAQLHAYLVERAQQSP